MQLTVLDRLTMKRMPRPAALTSHSFRRFKRRNMVDCMTSSALIRQFHVLHSAAPVRVHIGTSILRLEGEHSILTSHAGRGQNMANECSSIGRCPRKCLDRKAASGRGFPCRHGGSADQSAGTRPDQRGQLTEEHQGHCRIENSRGRLG